MGEGGRLLGEGSGQECEYEYVFVLRDDEEAKRKDSRERKDGLDYVEVEGHLSEVT